LNVLKKGQLFKIAQESEKPTCYTPLKIFPKDIFQHSTLCFGVATTISEIIINHFKIGLPARFFGDVMSFISSVEQRLRKDDSLWLHRQTAPSARKAAVLKPGAMRSIFLSAVKKQDVTFYLIASF
jgi:hypothetical protein